MPLLQIFIIHFHFILKAERQRFSSHWFLPQCLQGLGMGQAKARSLDCHPGLPRGGQNPSAWAGLCCLPGALAGSRNANGARTWSQALWCGTWASKQRRNGCANTHPSTVFSRLMAGRAWRAWWHAHVPLCCHSHRSPCLPSVRVGLCGLCLLHTPPLSLSPSPSLFLSLLSIFLNRSICNNHLSTHHLPFPPNPLPRLSSI